MYIHTYIHTCIFQASNICSGMPSILYAHKQYWNVIYNHVLEMNIHKYHKVQQNKAQIINTKPINYMAKVKL